MAPTTAVLTIVAPQTTISVAPLAPAALTFVAPQTTINIAPVAVTSAPSPAPTGPDLAPFPAWWVVDNFDVVDSDMELNLEN